MTGPPPRDESARERWLALLVLALAAYLLFAGLGARNLETKDISRTVEIARETYLDGRWLAPTREGEIEVEKPPFYVWIVALLGAATGKFGAIQSRLPAAAASFGSVLLVFAWGARKRGVALAAWAAAFLAVGHLFVELARISRVDSLLAFLLAVSVLAAHEADAPLPGGRRWGRTLGLSAVSGVALAAAMLTKSPLLAMVLHLAAVGGSILAELTLERPWREQPGSSAAGSYLRRLLAPGAAVPPLLALGLFAAWFVPFWTSITQDERDAVWKQFYFENLQRGVDGFDKPHPPWYYVPGLLGQAAPGAAFAIGFLLLRACDRTPLAPRVGGPFLEPAATLAERTYERFIHSWWVFPFVVLSISTGKQVRYLLPCLPGIALAAAEGLDRFAASRDGRALAIKQVIAWSTCAAAAVGALAVPVGAAVVAPEVLGDACWIAFAAAGVTWLAFSAGSSGNARTGVAALLLALFLGNVAYNVVFLPSSAYQGRKSPLLKLARAIPAEQRLADLLVYQIPQRGQEGEPRQRKLRLLLSIYREDRSLPLVAQTPSELLERLQGKERRALVEEHDWNGLAPIWSGLVVEQRFTVEGDEGPRTFRYVRRRD